MDGVIISMLTSAVAYLGARALDGTSSRITDMETRLRGVEAQCARTTQLHDHVADDLGSLRTEIRELREAIQSLAVAMARQRE
jgi:chromosome segregation ATPase